MDPITLDPAFLGDSLTRDVDLTWEGVAFEPGADWGLVWTGKPDARYPDSYATIQKTSGVGIEVITSKATITLVPEDTESLTPINLAWGILATHATTGERRTVAIGTWALTRGPARGSVSSIPIRTTTLPAPFRSETVTVAATTAILPAAAYALTPAMAAPLYNRLTSVDDITITIPANATTEIPVDTEFYFRRTTAAGLVTLALDTGVTLAGDASAIPIEAVFVLKKTATDAWDFI